MRTSTLTLNETNQYATLSVPSELASQITQILTENNFQIVNFDLSDIVKLSVLNRSYDYLISIFKKYSIQTGQRRKFKRELQKLNVLKAYAQEECEPEKDLIKFLKIQNSLKKNSNQNFLEFLKNSYLTDHIQHFIQNPKEQQQLLNLIPFFLQYQSKEIAPENLMLTTEKCQQEIISKPPPAEIFKQDEFMR